MEDVGNFLGGPVRFSFLTVADQLSDTWMGGTVAEAMKGQLQTFVDLGEIDSVLDDLSQFIDTSYLEAIDG
jgi:ABC-type taurine transport system substrate-binding protein